MLCESFYKQRCHACDPAPWLPCSQRKAGQEGQKNSLMRKITHIVLHCTATQPTATVISIQSYWRNALKWKSPGYHYLIEASGKVHNLHPEHLPSNGVAGHNANSIHVSYIGGIDAFGKPKDTRTQAQIDSMVMLLKTLRQKYPAARILGHRDFPGVNKACPSFDVASWLKTVQLS